MSTTTRALFALAALMAVAVVLWDDPAPAQIPDKFTNLKVLPKDIGKTELTSIMRGYAMALGVRCGYCHADENPDTHERDFASDEKEHKKIARTMMRMVGEINGTLIPKAGIDNPVHVQCVTCHRGVDKPETLQDLLLGVIETEGMEAAQTKYRGLREMYYGSASYDFSAGSLDEVAQTLAHDRGDVDGAITIMKLNLEFNPDAAYSHLLLGQLYAQKGDMAAAEASVKRCLELDPENRWAKRTLEQIQGKQE